MEISLESARLSAFLHTWNCRGQIWSKYADVKILLSANKGTHIVDLRKVISGEKIGGKRSVV